MFCLLFFRPAFSSQWLQSSHKILLPIEVNRSLDATNDFPLFWWNFAVLELKDSAWDQARAFCHQLETGETSKFFSKSACGESPAQFRAIIEDWAADQSRREHAPGPGVLRRALQDSLSQASLPIDSFLLSVLRMDPLSTYRRFMDLMHAGTQLRFEKAHGFFFDPQTSRIVVPIQMNALPSEIERTKEFLAQTKTLALGFPALRFLGLIGPHFSALSNEERIRSDVDRVGLIGPLLLLLQIVIAVIIGRWRLLLLVPPVILSTLATTAVIIAIFGGVHGLTLSFGPGIIGLSMDHGLHSCLNTRWKGAWKANWYGLLTTVAALAVMMVSSIPFLRQLMAFSIIGLFFGFGIYWVLHRRYTQFFQVEPLDFVPKPAFGKLILVIGLLIAFVAGCAFLRPDFGMQKMNYQSKEDSALTKWFFAHVRSKSPLLEIYGSQGQSPLKESAEQRTFANQETVNIETVANYLPESGKRRENLVSWRKLCAEPFTREEEKLFSTCLSLRAFAPSPVRSLMTETPTYLKDFGPAENGSALDDLQRRGDSKNQSRASSG